MQYNKHVRTIKPQLFLVASECFAGVVLFFIYFIQ